MIGIVLCLETADIAGNPGTECSSDFYHLSTICFAAEDIMIAHNTYYAQ